MDKKIHSLTGNITPLLVRQAYKKVRSKKGAAGVDGVTLEMFAKNLEENLSSLLKDLKDGSYRPHPLKRIYIPKGNGELRPLSIPTVRDRVAQQTIRMLLQPIFEPTFHSDSYGFRPSRNCQQALRKLAELKQKYQHILEVDIEKFFDSIQHGLIIQAVREKVTDGNILRIIQKFLSAGFVEKGRIYPTKVGTPQGGVISPLLANIVLNHLDWRLQQSGYRFVRYADDFVVVGSSQSHVKEARVFVQRVIENELDLKIKQSKTGEASFYQGFNFLGFRVHSQGSSMASKSVKRLKDKIRSLTTRHHNLDHAVFEKVNQVIRGTANYFAIPTIATCSLQFIIIDKWIRMRLRCMKFKRKYGSDNRRFRNKYFRRLGLLSFVDFLPGCQRT